MKTPLSSELRSRLERGLILFLFGAGLAVAPAANLFGETAQEELIKAKSMLRQAFDKNKELQEQKEAYERKVLDYVGAIEAKEKELQIVSQKLVGALESIEALTQENQKQSEASEGLKTKIRMLEKNQESREAQSGIELKGREQKIADLEAERAKHVEELEALLDQLKTAEAKMEEEKQGLAAQLTEAQRENGNLRMLIDDKAVDKLKEENQNLKMTTEDLEKQLKDSNAQLAEKTQVLQALDGELAELQKSAVSPEALEKAEQENAALKSTADGQAARLAELEQKIQEQEAQSAGFRSQQDEEIKKLKAAHQNEIVSIKTAHETQLGQFKAEQAAHETERAALEAENKAQDEKIKGMKAQIQSLSQEAQWVQNAKEKQKEMEQTVKGLRQREEALNGDNQSLRTKTEELTGLLRQASADEALLRKSYDQKIKDLREMVQKYQEMDVETVWDKLTEAKREAAQLKALNHSLEQQLQEGRRGPPSPPPSLLEKTQDVEKLNQKIQQLKAQNREDRVALFYNLGVVYAQFEMYQEAKRMFEKALDLNPYDAASHLNLGILFEDAFSEPLKAVEHYQAFIGLSQDQKKIREVEDWVRLAKHSPGGGRKSRIESAREALERLVLTAPY